MRHAFTGILTTLGILIITVLITGLMDSSQMEVEASGLQDPAENPIEATEESITTGGAIYARYCRSCHGAGGEGDGGGAPPDSNPPNLVDEFWDYGDTDPDIFRVIQQGVPPDMFMEPWAGRISDEDIWNTVNYLRNLAEQSEGE